MTKFDSYDLVFVKRELGRGKSHFPRGLFAFILYSYKDRYGGGEGAENEYAIKIIGKEGNNYCSWYSADDLVLIAKAGTIPRQGIDVLEYSPIGESNV